MEELRDSLVLLREILWLQNIEESHRNVIEKMTTSYHDIFTLLDDSLPCTSLASHKFTPKDENIINLRQPQQTECNREKIFNQFNEILTDKIVDESN